MQNWLQDYSDFCGNYGLIVSALHDYEFSVHYLHPNETRKPRLTSMTVKKTHIQYTHRINIMASHGISACNTCFLKTYIQRIQHAPSNVSSKSIKPTLQFLLALNSATFLAAGNVSPLHREDTWEYQSALCLILISSPHPPSSDPRHLPAFPVHATGSNEFPRSCRTLSHLTDPRQALKCGAIVCSIFAVIVKTKVWWILCSIKKRRERETASLFCHKKQAQ